MQNLQESDFSPQLMVKSTHYLYKGRIVLLLIGLILLGGFAAFDAANSLNLSKSFLNLLVKPTVRPVALSTVQIESTASVSAISSFQYSNQKLGIILTLPNEYKVLSESPSLIQIGLNNLSNNATNEAVLTIQRNYLGIPLQQYRRCSDVTSPPCLAFGSVEESIVADKQVRSAYIRDSSNDVYHIVRFISPSLELRMLVQPNQTTTLIHDDDFMTILSSFEFITNKTGST